MSELLIERAFAASRALVWANWTRAEHVQAWFAPDGYEVTACNFVARPGAAWRVEYRSSRGATYVEHGVFEDVREHERLVFTLTQDDGTPGPETRVEVTFVEVGGKTHVSFRQTGFESDRRREGNAEGWRECLGKLERNVAGEQELRALFAEWFRVASAKDIDGAMKPIASGIVSYEHAAPLEYRGVDAVRAVCQQGFDRATDDFTWTVPDLQIVVRGDIAITWGVNRMQYGQNVSHSRGTRVFQRMDGTWKMIHQHVSFPFDPATGHVKTDLAPEHGVAEPRAIESA